MSELNPSEAQRKAMIDYAVEFEPKLKGGAGFLVDGMIEAANSIPEGAPVGTIARRPDGAFVAVWVIGKYWAYTRVNREGDADWPEGPDADSWPQVRPDEWPVSKVYSTEEAAEILGVDLTAQQELTFPVVDPHGTVNMDGTLFTPKPRTPRVVDRLGVDEQGSRWRNRAGLEFRHDGTQWVSNSPFGDLYGEDYEPDALPPYTEITDGEAHE